jgi:adenylosuccinate synthase
MARIGITAGMVHYPKELREWVFASYKTAKRELESLGVKFNEFPEEVWKQINPLGFIDSIKNLTPFVCDTSKVLREAIRRGESLLIEGAQGAGLDIDHGTYPYVTSSTTLAAGASAGLGVPMSALGSVIGVMKAYTTCVGARPFPTELPEGKARDHIREVGNEYGASTGRARRIGYLDFVQLEQATSLNDTAALVLTKADVLSNTGRVGICTQYAEEGKKVITDFPTSFALQKCKGHITFVEGWGDISSVTEFNKLPKTFRKFVALIEDRLNIPVKAISTGPERSQLIIRKDINTPGLEFMDDL